MQWCHSSQEAGMHMPSRLKISQTSHPPAKSMSSHHWSSLQVEIELAESLWPPVAPSLWQSGRVLESAGEWKSAHMCPQASFPGFDAADGPGPQRLQELWRTGVAALMHVEPSQTRDRARVPFLGRQSPGHCAAGEALGCLMFLFPVSWSIR